MNLPSCAVCQFVTSQFVPLTVDYHCVSVNLDSDEVGDEFYKMGVCTTVFKILPLSV